MVLCYYPVEFFSIPSNESLKELGEDLRLTKHSPNLATMLLRNAPGSTLEGIHFRDFLPPAEVARAEELLCQSVEVGGQAAAQAFHTRMVDSCASQFRTEVFHVRYVDWNGATRHLIGLRDFTDQASLAQARATDAMMEMPPMVAPVPAVPPMLPPLLPLLEEGITWHSPKVKAADSLQVKMSDSLKVKMSDTLAIQQAGSHWEDESRKWGMAQNGSKWLKMAQNSEPKEQFCGRPTVSIGASVFEP